MNNKLLKDIIRKLRFEYKDDPLVARIGAIRKIGCGYFVEVALNGEPTREWEEKLDSKCGTFSLLFV